MSTYREIGLTEPWSTSDAVHGIQEPTIHQGNCQLEQIAWLRSARERLDAYDGPRWIWMFGKEDS